MTTQTAIPGDFFVGEKIGPYHGKMATVLDVKPTEFTVLFEGEEPIIVSRPERHLPVKPAPVQKVSFLKRVANFFA